jgi:hypothetical protein
VIRRRLVLAVSAVAALSVLLGSWLVLVVLEDRLVSNLDREFADGTLADEVRDAVNAGRGGPMVGRDRLDPVREVAVVAYGPTGVVEAAYPAGRLDDPEPLPDAGTVWTPRPGTTAPASGRGSGSSRRPAGYAASTTPVGP